MPDVDFFNFWRYLIGWIVTVYASVLTFQSLYGWYVWFSGGERKVPYGVPIRPRVPMVSTFSDRQ